MVFDNNGNKVTVTKSKNTNGVEENIWGWNYAKGYVYYGHTSNENQSGHIYNILKTSKGSVLKNAKKIVIPDGVTIIGFRGFQLTKIPLTTVVFPNSYTSTGIGGTFKNIAGTDEESLYPQLTNYTIRSDNPHFDSIDGIVYTEDKKTLCACPMNKSKVTIRTGTTTITGDAFTGNPNITSIGPLDSGADVLVPNTVTTIYNYWRTCPKLKWVELWNGLTTCNSQIIESSPNVKSVYIPKTVTTINKSWDSNYNQWLSMFTGCPSTVKIYCESTSKPSGWDDYWNGRSSNGGNKITPTWNVTRAKYRSSYRN